MTITDHWKRLSPAALNFWIQTFSLIAIFFEGYDQGVMGGVNSSPDYVTIFGCFAGGWVADRIGRINGTLVGAIFALIGGALQAATQNAAFILGARVVTGIGTGALTAIIPVYVSETVPNPLK